MDFLRNKNYFINFLNSSLFTILCFLPIILITGPFLSDLIVAISSILFFFLIILKKELYYLKHPLFLIFLVWCLYLIALSLMSSNMLLSLESSLFYFRFGFFTLSIIYILRNNKNFVKFFFFSIFFSFSILIFDSFFQFFSGKNLIGIAYSGDRISSFFGEEKILGSFFSRILPIFLALTIYLDFKKKYKILIIVFFFILIDILVYLSGERTAFFFLIFSSLLMVFLVGNFKYLRISAFLLSISIIFFISILNPSIKNRMIDKTLVQTNILSNEVNLFSLQHQVIYESSYKIFIDNKIFGIGPKMFREICKKKKYEVRTDLDHSVNGCQTSPHNYYLQLFTETGIIGAIPVITLFFFIIYIFFRQIYSRLVKKQNYISDFQAFLYIALFITIWPLVPTGNFFNNYISIIHYLPIGFLIFSYDKNIYINKP